MDRTERAWDYPRFRNSFEIETTMKSYALWNNKGGVGKSTITFHLATSYAQRYPDTKVLVIDMCPQANSSMMLLGGGTKGETQALELCQADPPKTVAGYIAATLARGEEATPPPWKDFLVKAKDWNTSAPGNISLLCGDGNLEPMAPLISDRASQAPLTKSSDPWRWTHELIRKLIARICLETEDNWLVLVDTNPSFSIYTEIAISSVDRLLVPVNADDASRVATNAMFTLIYGANPPHPVYGQYTFAARADHRSMERPKIDLIVGNRLTQYEGPATAFGAVSDATADTLFEAYKANPSRFVAHQGKSPETLERFRETYSIPLRDFNTAGVVAAHRGVPLGDLTDGRYDVYGTSVRVAADQLKACRKAVNEVVNRIGIV